MLHYLLQESAARDPDRTAVVDRGQSLTYRELDRASARLADELRSRGAGPGTRVGLYLDKSLRAVTAVWGVLRSGAAYVPLDVTSPAKRVALIVENGDLSAILAASTRWPALASELARPPSFVGLAQAAERVDEPGFAFETLDTTRPSAMHAAAPGRGDDPSNAAYILYTSGSTGQPKGVVLSHRAARSFVDWAGDVAQLGPDDRVSSHAPLHFDLSTFDLFSSCRAGAAVVLVPPELNVFPRNLADWIARERISVWYSVPSLLSRLALTGKLERHDWSGLRAIIFAGEVFPVAHLKRLRELIPGARYWNWYGPTETNVCTAYEVEDIPPEQTAPVPIGRACANCRLLVLDDGGRECARGEEGELCVSGPSLMTGYHGMPEATARVLASRGSDGALWYRTGDVVRQDVQGQLHLIGRRDGMIKSRGYRIELGEIETALRALGMLRECAVVAVEGVSFGGPVICCAYVPASGRSVAPAELRRALAGQLPGYMLPARWQAFEQLPKNLNGKIDRPRLKEAFAVPEPTPSEAT